MDNVRQTDSIHIFLYMIITKKAISTSVSNALDLMVNNGTNDFLLYIETVENVTDTDEFLVWLIEMSEQLDYRESIWDCLLVEYVYKKARNTLISFLTEYVEWNDIAILLFTQNDMELEYKTKILEEEILRHSGDCKPN